MVNRGAVILRYKASFIKWIVETDPTEKKIEITVDQANKERPVYLISDDDAENVEHWLSENHEYLFENELEGWYTDESLWPQKRDYKTFNEWFEVECHSMLIDTVGGEIIDDEV
ncbi:MAG: hypothetical protein ACLFQA_10790 [Bacteroidales bacterium]